MYVNFSQKAVAAWSTAEKGSEVNTKLKRKEFYNWLAMSALSIGSTDMSWYEFAFSGLWLSPERMTNWKSKYQIRI